MVLPPGPPPQMKVVLQNEENKEQPCNLQCGVAVRQYLGLQFLHMLLSLSRAHHTKVEVSEIPEWHFEHDETDAHVILYLNYAVKAGFKSAVVRTPDTYIFLYSHALGTYHTYHHISGYRCGQTPYTC